MNCQNFESIVNELARQQMMEANLREQALAHTADCQVCAFRLADERALTQKLLAVSSEMNEMEAPARFETELLAAFHQHKSSNQFTRRGRSAIHDWRYWATAAAAVLLIVIGIAAISMRSHSAPVAAKNPYVPTSEPKVADVKRNAAPRDVVDERKPEALPKQGTALASHNPRRYAKSSSSQSNPVDSRSESGGSAADRERTMAANYSGNEIATDFLPVGYTSPMTLQDGGQVMRVELPRSALAGFGLPVNMDRVNERVKADVLMGPDGQARAIRFVQ